MMNIALSATTLIKPDLLLTAALALVIAATGAYAAVIPQGRRSWWGLAGLLAVLVIASLQAPSALARTILLDLAGLAAVALVLVQPGPANKSAARLYLAMFAASVLLVAAGLLLGGENAAAPAAPFKQLAAAFLITGFAIKLALVPFFFWLPRVASAASPMTSVLLISVLGIAEFGELIHLRQAADWLFTDYAGVWLALALLSMLGGALLAMAQRDLKRMLAFSTIDDMGYLVLAVLVGTQVSLTGALLGAVSHAFFKVLLFGAAGIAEYRLKAPVTLDCRGLARRFPASSAMFIIGALGILGVPPLAGFAGRWRIYLSALQYGGLPLAFTLAAATGLALFYYVRAIHKVWLGGAPGPAAVGRAEEPRLAAGVLFALAAIGLAVGIFPAILQALM